MTFKVKISMIKHLWPCFLLITGCASLDDVVGGISNTPEWFQQRRVEIRGDGYPRLSQVPTVSAISVPQARMELGSQEAAAARAILEGHPRSEPSPYTPDQLYGLMAEYRPQVPDLEPKPEGFLSPEDIAFLRAQLVVPPVR